MIQRSLYDESFWENRLFGSELHVKSEVMFFTEQAMKSQSVVEL